MPSESQPAAHNCHHPTYPHYRDQFGEDPARFLYHLDPRPRIRGITQPGLVRAYLDVETDRSEPRRSVIAACNQRVDQLTQRVAADGGEEARDR